MLKIEEETTILESLDFEVKCARRDCNERAAWHGMPDCCDLGVIQCEYHRRDLDATLIQCAMTKQPFVHDVCMKPTRRFTWTSI